MPLGTRIMAVSAGGSHTLAITEQGSMWSWGAGDFGQLGLGDELLLDRYTPVEVPTPDGLRWVSIAAGSVHSVALSATGGVYTCGDGEGGRLGHGREEYLTRFRRVEGLLSGTRGVAISAGEVHTCAVTDNGRGYTWGHYLGLRQHQEEAYAKDGTTKRALRPIMLSELKELHVLSCASTGNFSSFLTVGGSPSQRRGFLYSAGLEDHTSTWFGQRNNAVVEQKGKCWMGNDMGCQMGEYCPDALLSDGHSSEYFESYSKRLFKTTMCGIEFHFGFISNFRLLCMLNYLLPDGPFELNALSQCMDVY